MASNAKNTLDAKELETETVKCAVEAQQKHSEFENIKKDRKAT